ncbi:unnamed protein product [Prorocentrum cordatum]|uniref:Protein kinase domain-containing protein n=1 Tax=Prorocentrum cordatum TaxID=2364126 RepID=A0ABN9X1A8_9DINO|nr:unnamed protein product [Polarella glacialis]
MVVMILASRVAKRLPSAPKSGPTLPLWRAAPCAGLHPSPEASLGTLRADQAATDVGDQVLAFARASSGDGGEDRGSALRGRRASFLAGCVPPLFRSSWRQGQPGDRDPAVELADGVGAHVPDHLRCENVTANFASFDRIGMGSSSVVYRAVRLSDNRRVVIKAMRRRGAGEAILARREFALLSDLKHPNIITALDFLESPSCVALVLEDIAGRSLRSLVRSSAAGRLDERSAVRLFVDAAAGLAYLHGRRVVHRDLKPDNLLVSRDGALKIIDFNVASSTEERASS